MTSLPVDSGKPRDPTNAQRQARLRASGRQLRAVLRDPAAIARLAELIAEHGSERAAIEWALSHAAE